MKLHNKIARRFGYELIKRKKHPTADIHTINLILAQGVDLVLDVGANQGQFVGRLRQQGYRGEVHSFEPVTATFHALQAATAGDDNWHAHQVALSEAPGEAAINVSRSSDLASFLAPSEFGADRYRDIAAATTETVTMSTVSDFLVAEIPGWEERRILLKMDTQGHDLAVFRGAVNALPAIVALLSELAIEPIYEGMPRYREVLAAYEEAGFHLTGIYPISRSVDSSLIEMDCMLINKRHAEVYPN